MAASDEDQDRDGSEAKPLLASQDSDLTLPPQTFVHGDFCSMHARIPNEEWDAGVCVCVCLCVCVCVCVCVCGFTSPIGAGECVWLLFVLVSSASSPGLCEIALLCKIA